MSGIARGAAHGAAGARDRTGHRVGRIEAKGLLLVAVLGLAACESKEERAEVHYERAVALLEDGEVERAAIELRNVFRLNGSHTPARLAYARLLREQDDLRGAFSQYLRLVEQDRRSVEGHRELLALALEIHDFEAVETHLDRAVQLAPDDPEIRAVQATAEFRRGARAEALARAEGVLAERPDNLAALMITIAERMAARDPAGALERADAALAVIPDDEGLHLARLAALEQVGDMAGAGAQLEAMAGRFPDNPGIRRALVQWHLRQGDVDAAEAVLRETAAAATAPSGDAATAGPDSLDAHLAVVQFLFETRGPEAARAELATLIDTHPTPRPFRRALAGLDFAEGNRETAIAAMRALATTETSSGERHDTEIALAQMLLETGAADEAHALVDSVLDADRGHVEALKLRARRAIAADDPEAAIRDMRLALGEAPRDPEVMTILAMAHEREGNPTLMGERLALAVETSGQAPAESIRYARFLAREGRTGPAEAVLVEALRRTPRDPDLLVELGRLHLERRDWPRTREVARLLREIGRELDDPAVRNAAEGLEAASLEGEGRIDEMVTLLQTLAEESGGDLQAGIGLVRARIAAGDLAGAEEKIAEILAADPGNPAGRMMQAGLHLLRGEAEEAETLYRALIAEAPGLAEPHQALFALLAGQGRLDDAEAALEAGIAATGGGDPEAAAGTLLFAKAGLAEARGDFEAAIALYERLYARNSADPVVANNLASLMAAHREDAASLERAFQIARRLRGVPVPQFQDTYGWILARRGAHDEALAHLEPAAAALADDPLVQIHLGLTYDALGRTGEAAEAFERALALAGDESPLPQVATVRARLAEIAAEPAPPAAIDGGAGNGG